MIMKRILIFILALFPALTGETAFADTAFITGQSLGSLRNNFSDYVGMKITIGGSDVTVTQLGRWVVSGNSGTHTVAVFNTSGTSLGSVSVNTSGATSGQYLYATLGSPITLTAGSSYYICTLEVSGGDQWYDDPTTVTPTAVATVTNSAYRFSGSFSTNLGANHSYGTVNFKYSDGSASPTRQPQPNTTGNMNVPVSGGFRN